jgi:hypothetical protein
VKFQGCGSNLAQATRTTIAIHIRFPVSIGVLLLAIVVHALAPA